MQKSSMFMWLLWLHLLDIGFIRTGISLGDNRWMAPLSYPLTHLSPEAQWDAVLPGNAKWQIIGFITVLEIWDEAGGTTNMIKIRLYLNNFNDTITI